MNVIRRLFILLSLAGGVLLAACAAREEYAVELGFYQDGKLRWDIYGSYGSFEECREAALARHEIYVRQDRAFSWACLLKDPETGGFSHRYR